jgi:hypothetical protein
MQKELFSDAPPSSPIDGMTQDRSAKALVQQRGNRARWQGSTCGRAAVRKVRQLSRLVGEGSSELVTNFIGFLARSKNRRSCS